MRSWAPRHTARMSSHSSGVHSTPVLLTSTRTRASQSDGMSRGESDSYEPWKTGSPKTKTGTSCRMKCRRRSEEHTSELQSLMRISYAVFFLKKKKKHDFNQTLFSTINYVITHTHTTQ